MEQVVRSLGGEDEARAALVSALNRAHVDLAEVSTAGDVAEPIVKCFHRRAMARRMGGVA